MYLSKVVLKARDSYEQHQAIWSLFPNVPERKRDHLFRIEQTNRSNSTVLLQSSTEPESNEHVKVLACKPFQPEVLAGAYYKFKLLGYPTRRLNQSRKIIEIKDPDERVQWLQRKLSGANVTVTAMDSFLVPYKNNTQSRFVCFEGILQVTDKAQIDRALVMGIGRKKHAGAGLLSLARSGQEQ
ncbi:Fis family transcriptional regulator [Endozoicomonas montiporae]|uniref:Fis family transcriptional regulator n=2 Tax=Endozoicomonas montiporae TaxID=1027273 RepID=A0A081N4M4_9GAMM|nr:type I-E CRISPR-associated protein Cas6/Cse3/CasE [Endozoicomonas montiporae]AMO57731.1 Fis family transcriptional regulator [Endozoicomonas montiporae CL-33]KEQ13397.1 Fis family transcriptional regulator [Endozoicomonas montiporae]